MAPVHRLVSLVVVALLALCCCVSYAESSVPAASFASTGAEAELEITLANTATDTDVMKHFAAWIKKFRRSISPAKLITKLAAFKRNLIAIAKHNVKSALSQLGLTMFSDLTEAEFAQQQLTFKGVSAKKAKMMMLELEAEAEAESEDNGDKNKNKKKTTPAKPAKPAKPAASKPASSGVFRINGETIEERSPFGRGLGPKKPSAPATTGADGFPSYFNWNFKPVLPIIKSQSTCGCCWAASVSTALSAFVAINGGALHEISYQAALDCAPAPPSLGCGGGYTEEAAKYFVAAGAVSEANYPYIYKQTPCATAGKQKIDLGAGAPTGYKMGINTGADLKKALQTGPVVVALDAAMLQNWKGGVLGYNKGDCTRGYATHAVVVVGWGEDTSTGTAVPYWSILNSYGMDWGGEEGFFRVHAPADGSLVCSMKGTGVYFTK